MSRRWGVIVEDDLVPLADVIRALRAQLKSAITDGVEEMLRFNVGAVELEFNAVVSREKSGGGKLSFKLLSFGAEGNLGAKISNNNTQKIKLVLTPYEAAPNRGDAKTSRRRKISISSSKSRKARDDQR